MGVNSLWEIVGPAARPVKLEALSRKKLAVDASIWIYQFLKAVRDKDGNKLGQLHIVGFFRRICKLLYFGILPVFVFDGGAPPLKRQVIQKRRERRQGSGENAQTTAQKLLAVQLQRRVREAKEADSASTVYLEDLPLLHPEHPQKAPEEAGAQQRFIRKDEYHLPEIKQFTVQRKDARIMPESEFEEYAAEASFDVVDGIPIDSVDPASAEFAELPMATQYMILSHLRLRSRLRLGYTKDQLEQLFPDSRDFSRFQIQQVQKRNFYTQRLMNVSGMDKDSGNVTRRIASDKDKRYALVKNDDGWTLALEEHDEANPIVLDDVDEQANDNISSQFIPRKKVLSALNTKANESMPKKEVVEVDDNLDSDDLEDVSLGDADPEVVNSGNEEPDEEDRAIIESIYDQFKHEYEPTEGKSLEAMERDELEQLDTQLLQRAIEESKKDYRKLQLQMGREASKKDPQEAFDFGQSILFGPETFKPTEITETHKFKVPIAKEAVGSEPMDPQKITPKADETEESESNPVEAHHLKVTSENNEPVTQNTFKEKNEARVWAIPTWFADNVSQVDSPYSQQDFVEAPSHPKKLDENEQAGLIPWAEAREMIENPDSDSDVEIIKETWTTDQGASSDSNKFSSHTNINNESETSNGLENGSRRKISVALQQENFSKDSTDAAGLETVNHSGNQEQPVDETEQEAPNGPEAGKNNRENIERGQVSHDASPEPELQTEAKPAKETLVYEINENDEEELIKNLETEEDQHEQFRAELGSKLEVPLNSSITDEQLLQEKLQKAKRDLDEVTETMIRDVQELLKRFGIPYITAPMEAEAQCAELFRMGLVDGIVTDDSDCFLFGGSRVYKNMFNQKQYVECYIAEDIEHKIGLDQGKLIELAMLLGSDYTEGIKGIGPVMAMEVLAEFGTLANFKKWFDRHTKTSAVAEQPSALEKKLLTRIKSGKLFLPDGFPSAVVAAAYTHPEVDHDDSELRWGVPSLDQIRTFLMYNVQWSQARVDEVMVPLIRDMNRKRAEGTQATIGEFFPQEYISYKKNVGMGKRMKVATSKLSR